MGKETKGTNAVTTTFAKFGDAKRHNYETLPTIDVEILPDVRHCEKCDAEMVWDPKGGYLGMKTTTNSGRHCRRRPPKNGGITRESCSVHGQ